MREKTAYRTVQVLSQGAYYRDEIIQVGLYRSNPCTHPLRMVSVLWQGTWYRYLTNVLDPQQLSARQVCELVPATLADRGCVRTDQTGVGFGLLVDGLHQCRPVADLRHTHFLCGAADALPAGGRGFGRTLGAHLGRDGVSCLLPLQSCRTAWRGRRSGPVSGRTCQTPGHRQTLAQASP